MSDKDKTEQFLYWLNKAKEFKQKQDGSKRGDFLVGKSQPSDFILRSTWYFSTCVEIVRRVVICFCISKNLFGFAN